MGIVKFGENFKRFINQNIGLFGRLVSQKGGVKELVGIYNYEKN